uniref:Uncharacterized protein n=1 Tax=Setaria viridis TaxID=4556 RepID=A0A4U6UR19_SETVI|nr:hypothetical protein SEVIR_5G297901v2 [Setaria viridis]
MARSTQSGGKPHLPLLPAINSKIFPLPHEQPNRTAAQASLNSSMEQTQSEAKRARPSPSPPSNAAEPEEDRLSALDNAILARLPLRDAAATTSSHAAGPASSPRSPAFASAAAPSTAATTVTTTTARTTTAGSTGRPRCPPSISEPS